MLLPVHYQMEKVYEQDSKYVRIMHMQPLHTAQPFMLMKQHQPIAGTKLNSRQREKLSTFTLGAEAKRSIVTYNGRQEVTEWLRCYLKACQSNRYCRNHHSLTVAEKAAGKNSEGSVDIVWSMVVKTSVRWKTTRCCLDHSRNHFQTGSTLINLYRLMSTSLNRQKAHRSTMGRWTTCVHPWPRNAAQSATIVFRDVELRLKLP